MTRATCTCGTVVIEMTGAPIMAVECGCTSCQTAGAAFDDALTDYGTTPYTVIRKDRVRLISGAQQLVATRLTPESTTRRVVAGCCGAPMFLDFQAGHWLSLFTARLPEAARRPLDMRTMTGDLPDRGALPRDVANLKKHSVGFMLRLIAAWAAMGFRTPKLDWGKEI